MIHWVQILGTWYPLYGLTFEKLFKICLNFFYNKRRSKKRIPVGQVRKESR